MFFFIGCTHAFHNKMLELRSLPNLDSMNQLMADSINSVVQKNDILVHVGDFAFGSLENCIKFRGMINCKNIWLTSGNHDQRFLRQKEYTQLFGKVRDILIVKGKLPIVVCHYPIESWPSSNYGSLHVHSHCHKPIRPMTNRFNVNVDVGGYVPVSQDQLYEKAVTIQLH